MRTRPGRLLLLVAAILAVAAVPLHADLPGDLVVDGRIDFADAAALLPCLSGPGVVPAPPCSPADLTGDGCADLADAAALARLYGACDCQLTSNASSVEGNNPALAPERAIDGLLTTRWSSAFADDQWLQLDFVRPRALTGLTIHWETAYARVYAVRLSDDGVIWRTVFTTSNGDGGRDTIAFAAQSAAHLRVHCIQRATAWGNSIWELEPASPDRCYRACEEHADTETRIECLVAAMALDEKTSFVHGAGPMNLRPIPRLGLPAFNLADGPLGARGGGDAPIGTATAFPAPIAMASTWDVALVEQFGVAIGREFRNEGRQMWLGPGMNIIRIPQNGRNFEYYSEDPFLAGRMAVASIRGAQAQGVVACAKHFACNNQETDRGVLNVIVDERTLREIYLPPFEAAVREADVGAVMAAYNRVNGLYCTAQPRLLKDILKTEWGFRGLVVSDWGAVHETIAPVAAGLDLEMDGAVPTGAFWGQGQLLAAVQSGQVSEAAVDEQVRRILRALARSGVLDGPWDAPNADLVENWALARELAAQGIVLLKNDSELLPLDPNAPQSLALLGPNCAVARTGGGGSSLVTPPYTISPLVGIADAVGPQVSLVHASGMVSMDDLQVAGSVLLRPPSGIGQGLEGQYFNNPGLQGTPVLTRVDAAVNFHWGSAAPAPGVNADFFSVRWRGTLTAPTSGVWTLAVANDDGARLYLNGELLIDDWRGHAIQLSPCNVTLAAGQPYDLVIEYFESAGSADIVFYCDSDTPLITAAALAAAADTALVFVGTSAETEGEGFDRASLDLPPAQVALIRAVAAANPATVVVIVAGSQVGMHEWIDDVPTVLQAWFGGQEAGHALADVVCGAVNPGAKLPLTFVRRWQDHPAATLYPGGAYNDGLGVGYRYFDSAATPPLFPFGHGRSYTTFAYGDLDVDTSSAAVDGTVRVTFTLQNTGTRPGAEVAQVYVRDPVAGVWRPYKELKGFVKATLAPGEARAMTVVLDPRAFTFYNVATGTWQVEPGTFEILVGASAGDIRLAQSITYP